MFAGIDIAAERHMLARLDAEGRPIGKPIAISEDREGYETLLRALGAPPVLVAVEATGHYWKNLFAALTAAGHQVALLNHCSPGASRMPVSNAPRRTRSTPPASRVWHSRSGRTNRLHDEASRFCASWSAIATGCGRISTIGSASCIAWSISATRVHPRRPQPRQHARHLSAGRISTAHAFARATPRRLADCATTDATWSATNSPDNSSRPQARSATTTDRPTPCRRATSARIWICGDAASPRSSMTSRTCSTRMRSASCCSPSTASAAVGRTHHRRGRRSSRFTCAAASPPMSVWCRGCANGSAARSAPPRATGNARLRWRCGCRCGAVRRTGCAPTNDACAGKPASSPQPHAQADARHHSDAKNRRPSHPTAPLAEPANRPVVRSRRPSRRRPAFAQLVARSEGQGGPRAPPKAARSVLDRSEHDDTLAAVGRN